MTSGGSPTVTPRRTRARAAAKHAGPMPAQLPAELARRIEALDARPPAADFDRAGWLWLALLGVALPLALIVLGWWL